MNVKSMASAQFVLSALCVALLSACGGDDAPSLLDNNGEKVGFLGSQKGRGVEDVDVKTHVVSTFSSEGMVGIGQQLNPTVTAMKGTNEVKLNQPGLISEVCALSKCESLSAQVLSKDKNTPPEIKDAVVVVDTNGNVRPAVGHSTIDYVSPSSPKPELLDAGTTPANLERMADGSLQRYTGNVGKEFNEVVLIGRSLTGNVPADQSADKYLSSYFRGPGAAGWSYQTFGLLFNEDGAWGQDRSVRLGYQTIGQATKGVEEMPEKGKATYTGISHAYYNDHQVTMRNKIDADFSKRTLHYQTTENPLEHTFENNNKDHVVQQRPDLKLAGSASWYAKQNTFKGTIESENLKGLMEGRFYGPNAEEVGGVFGLNGQENGKDVQYVGGFGASRASKY